MQLFDALYHEVVSQIDDSETYIEISNVNSLGRSDIKLVYQGKRFLPPERDVTKDPYARVIETYAEKLSYSYRGGYNVIRISLGKSTRAYLLPNVIAIFAALIVSLILTLTLDEAGTEMVLKEWITPLQTLFTNAVLMIGAPMTLFSLLKNLTDTFIVSERHSSAPKLFVSSMISSLVALALSLLLGFTFARTLLKLTGDTESIDIGLDNWTLSSAVDQIIPSSILEPFQSISPVPMIVVVLLVAGALCIMGKNFELMKRAIDACYDLFSSILRIVMVAFPVACFLLFVEVLLSGESLVRFIILMCAVVIVIVCTIPLLIVYGLKLKIHKIKVFEFAKKIRPLIKENFMIGSVINAIPYNTRYCEKVFGFKKSRLEKELPVLAQTSLDGNCFILMLLATIYIFIANCPVSWHNIAVLALIVLFLSFGAPNQPGSILIGMLIIFTYLNSGVAISMALCFELFLGGLQNILNVISSIVTVAINEYREKAREAKQTPCSPKAK